MELAYQLDEPVHMHQDIELLYLVNNEVRVQTDTSFVMKENDIIIFNSGEEHALRCKLSSVHSAPSGGKLVLRRSPLFPMQFRAVCI